ncbi:MAG: hypothetical protein B6242_06300 [Anaerolineaceae bacterium 4572_78]|nr:MAG: hypothetical protein B6242_06300 [Anaerolineaceae bacterium 4572_78]
MSDSLDILQTILGELTSEDYSVLEDVAVAKTHPPETVLCEEGEVEHTFYIIEKGLVSVTRRMTDNTEQVLAILNNGQSFGEMALLENSARSATVRTITECKMIEISEDIFRVLVQRSPSVAIGLLRGVSRALRDANSITLAEMELKNYELQTALEDLKAAQAELLRQERLKRDLEIASDVQRSILPTSFPEVDGFEFAVCSRPAREVGGDFYDVFKITDYYYGLVVADVSGKSWQAALFMAIVRALLLREAENELSPAKVMHRLHQQVLKTSTAEMYVTIFYAIIDIRTNSLRYVRAGHEKPILYDSATQTLQLINPPGRFVGLWANLIVEESVSTMKPGDYLICYSDGVTDAEDTDGNRFGLERLLDIVLEYLRNADRANEYISADNLVTEIRTTIDDFSKEATQADDITILVTKAV